MLTSDPDVKLLTKADNQTESKCLRLKLAYRFHMVGIITKLKVKCTIRVAVNSKSNFSAET